jgi:AcrR family transcriptional regulator
MRADAVRNRDLLLQSARELFAERGLNVSMDEVARHAGVGVGTAYRRFASRLDLIDALVDERVAEVEDNIELALDAEDPWAGFVAFMEAHVAIHVADRGLRELFHSHGHLEKRLEPVRARLGPRMEEILARAGLDGLAIDDVAVMTQMLTAAADAGGDWRRFLNVLLAGLDARGAGQVAQLGAVVARGDAPDGA